MTTWQIGFLAFCAGSFLTTIINYWLDSRAR
jgi:hypothetical protein